MGFDCTKIPTIINARNVASKYRFAGFEKDAITVSNVEEFDQKTVKDIQMGIHYSLLIQLLNIRHSYSIFLKS